MSSSAVFTTALSMPTTSPSTGPATLCARSAPTLCMRSIGPCSLESPCRRASGKTASLRQSTPRRSSIPKSVTARPCRFHETGRRHQARRSMPVYGSSCFCGPWMPCSHTSGASASGRSGRISSSTRCTSAATPTGSTMLNCCAVPDCCCEMLFPLMRLILTAHQPNGRHSMDCVTSTAKMRPGGIVSVTVVNSP